MSWLLPLAVTLILAGWVYINRPNGNYPDLGSCAFQQTVYEIVCSVAVIFSVVAWGVWAVLP